MSGGHSKKKRARGQSKKTAPPKAKTFRTGDISDFFGVLAGKTKKVATIEEINEAAAAGWAEGGLAGLTCAGYAERQGSMKDLSLDCDPSRNGRFEPGGKVSSFKRKPF